MLIEKPQEEILDPDLPIVDCHHHLRSHPYKLYKVEEFAQDLKSGHKIISTVHVECGQFYRPEGPEALQPVGETEQIAKLTAKDICVSLALPQLCTGIVGYADLTIGASVRDVLNAHITAGNGRFRGIRYTAPWDASREVAEIVQVKTPHLLLDTKFRKGFAQLASLNLSFETWLFHHQIDDVIDLARTFPDTTIILNHVGTLLGVGAYKSQRDDIFRSWSDSIRKLSGETNVYVKLGGLGMKLTGFGFEHHESAPGSVVLADTWRPYLETCIQAFGPARCMFESNFPVDSLSCSYSVLWNTFKRIAQGYNADERRDMFSKTAQQVYRI